MQSSASIVFLYGADSVQQGIKMLLCPSRVPRRHIVDTDIHFYHVPTHADASRKRITEDTEDWRPRTGTTQSRSFRILAQITGTENGTMSAVGSLVDVMIKASLRCCFQQQKH